MDVVTPADPVPTPKQIKFTSSTAKPKPKPTSPPVRKPASPVKDTTRKHITTNTRAEKAPRDPLYDEYMSAGEDDDEEEDHRSASNDLSDYLSHSIAFDHSIDFYISEHDVVRKGNKNMIIKKEEDANGSKMNGDKKTGMMGSRGPKV